MREVRWHARAGQGAKTAAQLLALAGVKAGRSVQAFPEYGPERRGSPIRAFTRLDDRPIRRRYAIERPDVAVVLDPSLVGDPSVTLGLEGGVLLVNTSRPPAAIAAAAGFEGHVVCVPASRIARAGGSGFVNVAMLGAAAGVLGDPPLEAVAEAVDELLARKLSPEGRDSALAALERGHELAREAVAWAL